MSNVKSGGLGKGFWQDQELSVPSSETEVITASDLFFVAAKPASPVGTWRTRLAAVLPHEWIFGTFLLLTAVRLAVHGGPATDWSIPFFSSWLAALAVLIWAERNPSPTRQRVRLLFYPAAMGLAFFALGKAVPLLGYPKVDRMLLGWDQALLGATPSVAWEPWLHPWLENLMMASYLFFFYYLVTGPGRYCLGDLPLFRKCIVGLFTLYGLAFTGYTVMPAGGPHRWMTFATPLHGWLLDWTLKPVNEASNSVDVFPSIHVAATLYLLLFDWHHARRRFWWVLSPCLLLWVSTLYLRFHYFVDLLAGVAVGLAGWWMAECFAAKDRRSRSAANLSDRLT
jgi:hypothetical protein